MKSGLTITVDKVADVIKSINALVSKEVMVGIPDSNPARRGDDPMNNAALGYIHEHGSPAANVPARPWLVPGVKDAQPETIEHLQKASVAALNGDAARVQRELVKTGLNAQNKVRAKLNAGVPPKLEDSTLRARRRRGRTGTKPLIDTGQMRNATTYVIREV